MADEVSPVRCLWCVALLAGAAVWGGRLEFHFVARELANLTFELDAMAGLSGADGEAFRALWRRESSAALHYRL